MLCVSEDTYINMYACLLRCDNLLLILLRVEFLPEEMTFFRTCGRKWKKLISSISSAEDLEESGRKWNKWNVTNIKNKINVL